MKRLFIFTCLIMLGLTQGAAQEIAVMRKLSQDTVPEYPPFWSYSTTIYEVNLRQYTKSGTIKEFMPHLERLQKMGVGLLWFMPVQPIGLKNRKGSLGSYYSISDYVGMNSEFGTMEEWQALVEKAHDLGMYVILDWVANHTAFDHPWIKDHPEYYVQDEKGVIKSPVEDWTDAADLNYNNLEMRMAMIESMKFWVRTTKIDGFRCDVAEMVPVDFWPQARAALEQVRPGLFMLAEGEKPELHKRAFDMTYTWSLFHPMNDIAAGKKNAKAIDEYLKEQKSWPSNAFRMYFTSNHDENSWNGSNHEKMGVASRAFAVLTFGLNGMPLIYSGQEANLNKRLRFFDKDTIQWNNYPYGEFYTKLARLKATEKALEHGEKGGEFIKLASGNDENVYAFMRRKGTSKVVFILNLSSKNQKVTLENSDIAGSNTEIFTNINQVSKSKLSLTLAPWEYKVYTYK
jgi:cyclomaltodextrinase